jgi:hypothetical protein
MVSSTKSKAGQGCHLFPRKLSHCALRQLAELHFSDCDSDQPQHFNPKPGKHSPDVPVLPLIKNDFDPAILPATP